MFGASQRCKAGPIVHRHRHGSDDLRNRGLFYAVEAS
jgi:hypothetical protein